MMRVAANSPAQAARMRWVTPWLAIVLAFALGAVLLLGLGQNPLAVYYVFFVEPFLSPYSVGEVVNKTTTLAVIALGLAVCFRANVWNIGAEGQLTMGAVAAAAVAVHGEGLPAQLLWMAAAGAAAGAAWGMVPAFLRVKCGVNEILVSLMLVYVAQLLLSYAVYGPLKDPQGFGFPQSPLFGEAALLPVWVADTRLFASVALLPLTAVAVAVLVRRTRVGFEMRVAGMEAAAARFAGFSLRRPVWVGFAVSGGLAGGMGMVEVAGPIGQLTEVVSPGYGFTAIIVAFLGRLSPLAIVGAALLMALVSIGGESAQIEMQLPPSISHVFQGLVLFCLLAMDFFVDYRLRRV